MMKFLRVPAAFGGAMIAGLAYLQYQAQRQYTPPPSLLYVLIELR